MLPGGNVTGFRIRSSPKAEIIGDEKRKFLHELKGEAKEVGREFEVLFEETMQQPPEQRTSG